MCVHIDKPAHGPPYLSEAKSWASGDAARQRKYGKPEYLTRTVDERRNGSIKTMAAEWSFSEKGACTSKGRVMWPYPKLSKQTKTRLLLMSGKRFISILT